MHCCKTRHQQQPLTLTQQQQQQPLLVKCPTEKKLFLISAVSEAWGMNLAAAPLASPLNGSLSEQNCKQVILQSIREGGVWFIFYLCHKLFDNVTNCW